MKAIVYRKSGSRDVLQVEEIEKPMPFTYDAELQGKHRARTVICSDT